MQNTTSRENPLDLSYLQQIRTLIDTLAGTQAGALSAGAEAIADALKNGRFLYAFGTGHSHMMALELFYRAGGLARVCPILDTALMLHDGAVKSSFVERVEGYAAEVLARYPLQKGDVLLIASNSGRNAVPIEMAREAKARGATVIALTSRLDRMQVSTARILFLAYSVLTGITFSVLPLAYGISTMFIAFGFTALMFGSMAVIGMTTQKDLSGLGPILMTGLITMIIMTVVGWFIDLSAIEMVLNYVMVGLFLALTAYDMQKMRAIYYSFEGDEMMLSKLSIYSALDLYLDFINIFLYVLRILARNSKN